MSDKQALLDELLKMFNAFVLCVRGESDTDMVISSMNLKLALQHPEFKEIYDKLPQGVKLILEKRMNQ